MNEESSDERMRAVGTLGRARLAAKRATQAEFDTK